MPDKKTKQQEQKNTDKTAKTAKEAEDQGNDKSSKKSVVKKKRKLKFKTKAILVLSINALGILALFFINNLLAQKAIDIKKYRNDLLRAEKQSEVELADLEIQSNIEQAEKLYSLFPDEEGLVEFVKEIERLKIEGVVNRFSFANEKAVRDKTGSFGIPFIIELEGGWQQIDTNLQDLQKINFLIRPITIDIQIREVDGNNVVNFNYGGFIYVDEELGKNR